MSFSPNISETIKSNGREGNLYVHLEPDKDLNHFTFTFPVKWVGTINSNKVIITQSEYHQHVYDGPAQYEHYLDQVYKMIDDKLRIMD